MSLRDSIARYPGFPKAGVVYHDVAPLLADPHAFRSAVDAIAGHFSSRRITHVAAIEAKGFALGGALAYRLNRPLALIRKPGLTPGAVMTECFEKEYGEASYEIRPGLVAAGDSVVLVYDILAGPGATRAAIRLIERSGAALAGAAFAIELTWLAGREALAGYDLFTLAKF